VFHSSRESEAIGNFLAKTGRKVEDLEDCDKVFAVASRKRTTSPRGWLVDLINRFGYQGGFDGLVKRFNRMESVDAPLILAILQPFKNALAYLTHRTIRRFFFPLVVRRFERRR
jgi:hypothetical protein